MSTATQQVVSKAWNFAHVLRDDGLSYMSYIEQITFLLFLKMADEQTKPPYNREEIRCRNPVSVHHSCPKRRTDTGFPEPSPLLNHPPVKVDQVGTSGPAKPCTKPGNYCTKSLIECNSALNEKSGPGID